MKVQTQSVALILPSAEIGKGIKAEMSVLGSQRQMIQITFQGNNGPFEPQTPLQLTPEVPITPNSGFITLRSGSQKLNISNLTYLPPSVRSAGFLSLDCDYTDVDGSNSYNFQNDIGFWALTDVNYGDKPNNVSTQK